MVFESTRGILSEVALFEPFQDFFWRFQLKVSDHSKNVRGCQFEEGQFTIWIWSTPSKWNSCRIITILHNEWIWCVIAQLFEKGKGIVCGVESHVVQMYINSKELVKFLELLLVRIDARLISIYWYAIRIERSRERLLETFPVIPR